MERKRVVSMGVRCASWVMAAVCLVMLHAGCAVSQTVRTVVPPPLLWDLGKYRPMTPMDDATFESWLARWEKNILNDSRNRYCDKANGEDIGWLMTPFMDGFFYGFLATGDEKWIAMEFDWADSWIKRAVKEPDGYLGWPKAGAAGTKVDNLDDFVADSLLGEAMALRPLVLLSAEVLKRPALKERFGAKSSMSIPLAR